MTIFDLTHDNLGYVINMWSIVDTQYTYQLPRYNFFNLSFQISYDYDNILETLFTEKYLSRHHIKMKIGLKVKSNYVK